MYGKPNYDVQRAKAVHGFLYDRTSTTLIKICILLQKWYSSTYSFSKSQKLRIIYISIKPNNLFLRNNAFLKKLMSNGEVCYIVESLGCVFADPETHESGVPKYTKGKGWSEFR